MATNTLLDARVDGETYILPEHPSVTFQASRFPWGVSVEYHGSLTVLLKAGCITQHIYDLSSRKHARSGRRLFDERGHQFRRTPKPTKTEPDKVRLVRMFRGEHAQEALKLPGVRDASRNTGDPGEEFVRLFCLLDNHGRDCAIAFIRGMLHREDPTSPRMPVSTAAAIGRKYASPQPSNAPPAARRASKLRLAWVNPASNKP